MAKKKLVNAQTEKSVSDFIDAVENEQRQSDSRELLKIFKKITGKEPKLWGKKIVGYGKYSYSRKNGDEFEWFNTGFSPTKAHLSIYVMYDINSEQSLLKELGPHKTGKGCLYIKKLEDVNLKALEKIISKSHEWVR